MGPPSEISLGIGGSYVAILHNSDIDPESDGLIVNWRGCSLAAVRVFVLIIHVGDACFDGDRSCHLLWDSCS
jgi:hypothetical protein